MARPWWRKPAGRHSRDQCDAIALHHAVADAHLAAGRQMACHPRPSGRIHNRIERSPPDAAIADADKIRTRRHVEAASEHGNHARRGVTLAEAFRVRTPSGNGYYRTHCRAISVASAFDD